MVTSKEFISMNYEENPKSIPGGSVPSRLLISTFWKNSVKSTYAGILSALFGADTFVSSEEVVVLVFTLVSVLLVLTENCRQLWYIIIYLKKKKTHLIYKN